MLCRKINARKNRTKVFLLLFSFTFTFYTTQSFQVGAPWCSLQVGFTHFEEYELVFLSFPAQNVHRTLRPPFGAPWVRPTGAFGTSIPNSEAHVLIFFCNSFCIPVLFCKRISSCSLRSLFQVISKILIKILNLPPRYSKSISQRNSSKLFL